MLHGSSHQSAASPWACLSRCLHEQRCCIAASSRHPTEPDFWLTHHPLLACCAPLRLQSVTHARITFKNEATGEYTFYELKYSAAAPAPQGNLMLECPVRTVTSTRISIANPLDTAVTLKSTISSKQVGPWGDLGRRG